MAPLREFSRLSGINETWCRHNYHSRVLPMYLQPSNKSIFSIPSTTMKSQFLTTLGLLATLSLPAGCDESPGGSSASDSGSGGSGGCDAGSQWCSCVQSKYCDEGLYCSPEVICVPDGNASDTGNNGSGSDSGGTDGGCSINADCPETDVCDQGQCVDIDAVYFDFEVTYFEPINCDDGWGDAELFYKYFEDEIEQGSTGESTCPGSWAGDYFLYDSLKSFNLEFWELDAFFDDYLTSMCWGDLESCGPVPKSILHDGIYWGMTSDDLFYVEIFFYPVQFGL